MLSQNAADKDRQLALYQIAIENSYENVKSVKLVWHYLQYNQKIYSQRNEQQLNELKDNTKNRIDEIRAHIQNGGAFAPKESILCNWCYYWEECSIKSGTNPYI